MTDKDKKRRSVISKLNAANYRVFMRYAHGLVSYDGYIWHTNMVASKIVEMEAARA